MFEKIDNLRKKRVDKPTLLPGTTSSLHIPFSIILGKYGFAPKVAEILIDKENMFVGYRFYDYTELSYTFKVHKRLDCYAVSIKPALKAFNLPETVRGRHEVEWFWNKKLFVVKLKNLVECLSADCDLPQIP